MQRKRINEANEALAEEEDTAPPTTKKPRLDAAVTQPKKDDRKVKAKFKAATAENDSLGFQPSNRRGQL